MSAVRVGVTRDREEEAVDWSCEVIHEMSAASGSSTEAWLIFRDRSVEKR